MSTSITKKKVFSLENSNTGSGTVQSVNSGTDITIDNTDPANPIVNFTGTYQDPITVVANYSALPVASTVNNKFYWAQASQGTKWLPGSLGGTYYSAGLYHSNGSTWEFIDVPYQATQAEVNTGTNTDKFVTPSTLANSNYAYTDEKAQDAVGNILTDSTTVDFTYNDAANTITAIVIDDSITNSKLANVSTQTIKGRTTAGTGDPEDLTKAQAQGILGLPSSSTDNQIVRFDGTLGNIQGSPLTIDDNGGIITAGIASSTFTAKKIEYDNTINQWILYDNDSSTALNVGYETWFICLNNTGSSIPNGSVVYISGASGGVPTIALAKADAASTSVGIGITTEAIANNATGKVTQSGLVNGVDTSALSAGAVYVSASTAGALTNTAPISPNYRMRVGFVGVINATTGTILVTPSTAALGNGTESQVLSINSSGSQVFKYPSPIYLRDTMGNADKTMTSAFTQVAITAAFTASRTLTLPLASAYRAGQEIAIVDEIGTITSVNTLILAMAGSDTIDGGTSWTATSTYASLRLISDGTSKWTIDIVGIGRGGTGATTAAGARNNLGIGSLAVMDYNNDISAYRALGSAIIAQSVGLNNTRISTGAALTSQAVFFIAVYLEKGQSVTGVKWYQSVKGSYTASNYNGVGLYTYNAGTLTLVASSTNDGTCWSTANSNTIGNKAFSSPYVATAGIYYVGFVWSASATITAPSVGTSTGSTSAAIALDFTNGAKLAGSLATQTSLPSPQALSGTTTVANNIWIALY